MTRYSILTEVATDHANQLYLAKCEDFPGRYEFNVALTDGASTVAPTPVLPIRLDIRGPRLDYLPIINLRANLCSIRFITVLTGLGVPFTAYPAQVRDTKTEMALDDAYVVWRPITVADAVDWDRSRYALHPVFHQQKLCELVLTDACLQSAPPLFKDNRYSEWLIRNDIGQALVDVGVTGISFYALTMPIDERWQPGNLIAGQATPPGMEP